MDQGLRHQARAELDEAVGQIQNAKRCLGEGIEYPPCPEYCMQAGHHVIRNSAAHREICAHRIREAIGNLQDVLRFMDAEVP